MGLYSFSLGIVVEHLEFLAFVEVQLLLKYLMIAEARAAATISKSQATSCATS